MDEDAYRITGHGYQANTVARAGYYIDDSELVCQVLAKGVDVAPFSIDQRRVEEDCDMINDGASISKTGTYQ